MQKKNNKEVVDTLIFAVMNPKFRIGYRRRLLMINRIKDGLLNYIADKQEEIKRKHCR